MSNILLEKIVPDENQPRKKFILSEMEELRASILDRGILAPLIVESNFEGDKFLLIDGERRYRCAKELELKEVPVSIIDGPLSFEDRTVLRFHIQEKHKDWSVFDKARAIYELKNATKLSIVEIAKKLNSNAPRIHNWLSIINLTDETQLEVIEEKISFSYLIHLVKTTKDYLSFSDLSQRDIEKKLIAKIKANTFETTLNFQKFSRVMSSYTHETEKLEFLNNVEMKLDELLVAVKLEETIDLEKFYKSMVVIDRNLSSVINKKHSLSQDHLELLHIIQDKIKEVL